MKMRWMVVCLLMGMLYGQSVQTGRSSWTGTFMSQGQIGGLPVTYAARTDLAVFGAGVPGELLPAGCSSQTGAAYTECLFNAYNASATAGHQGAALSYTGSATQAPPAAGTVVSGTNIYGLNAYLNGMNTRITDPDFGTLMVRATDASLNSAVACLGGSGFGNLFNLGSSGNTNVWASDETRILIFPTGKPVSMLAFDPAAGIITPTDLCGGYMPGATSFSSTNPHRLYTTTTDQENTVVFTGLTGQFLTGETVTNGGGASAILQAINPASNFAQLGVVTGTETGNVWTGQTSGASFTAVSNPPRLASGTPYANAIYKGVLCDGTTSDPDEAAVCGTRSPWYGSSNACANAGNSTNPACWYVQWELLFEFNYLPGAPDTVHFPTAQNSCMPQNYNASYTGVFGGSDDDTSFSIVYSDNGQANHTGYDDVPNDTCPGAMGAGATGSGGTHVCTGPVYNANFTLGQGCRMLNTMTDTVVGDWGTTGQLINGQANLIPISTVTNTPVANDIFIQEATGAETQLMAMEDTNGMATNSSWPGFSGWTQAFTGLIYQNGSAPNATSKWYDCGAAPTSLSNCYDGTHLSPERSFTPTAVPSNPPYYYPDVMHDGDQSPQAGVTRFSLVQQPNMEVNGASAVCHQGTGNSCSAYLQSGFTISVGQTVINYQNNATYSPGQQFVFFGLTGAHDQYLNCLLPAVNYCPVWTAVGGGDGSAAGGSIIITDAIGAAAGYTDAETYSSSTKTPLMTPNGQLIGVNGLTAENYWQTPSLVDQVSMAYGGHSGIGYVYYYQGKSYAAVNMDNPSRLATTDGNAGSPLYGPAASLAEAQTPPPGSNYVKLLPISITDQQHGTYGPHGSNDAGPVVLFTALNCGQATSAGSNPCETVWGSALDSELVGMENWAARSSPGNLVGADCNYGSGPAPCVYRLGHTFSTNSSWNFNAQNAIGNCGPLGDWCIFPSDWNLTLGCMDLTSTSCWSSWEASAPTASGTGVSWTSDGATPPNVTIEMTNSFCPTGGTQYYWISGAIQSIACGTRAGTVQLTGFAESWFNTPTLTLGPNTANNWQCDSSDANAGTCSKFVLAGVTGAPGNSSGTETGVQKAVPTACSNGVPCARADLWLAKVTSAHQ